jgi:Uri superfamily endonuclease
MNAANAGVLLGELDKGLDTLTGLQSFFEQSLAEDLPKLGRGRSAAVLLAGIIDTYYTCLETMFFRISQFFENSLSKDRWHADLLKNMRIAVKGERVEVIRDETFSCLDEIRRFRHFNRYYYNLEYDWDRIDFLVTKMRRAQPLVTEDIRCFMTFVGELSA